MPDSNAHSSHWRTLRASSASYHERSLARRLGKNRPEYPFGPANGQTRGTVPVRHWAFALRCVFSGVPQTHANQRRRAMPNLRRLVIRFLSYSEGYLALARDGTIGTWFSTVAAGTDATPRVGERLAYLSITGVARTLERVLHIAPERCLARFLFSAVDRYVPLDIERHSPAMRLDLTLALVRDKTFDLMAYNQVLDHIPDDDGAMRETLGIPGSGPLVILQVLLSRCLSKTCDGPTTCSSVRLKTFGQLDRVRICGPDYAARLSRRGWFELCQRRTGYQGTRSGVTHLFRIT